MLKRRLTVLAVILGIIILSYGWVWLEFYHVSHNYYNKAMENFEKGDYIIALKGDQVLTEDQSRYVFEGGFQQVISIWSSPYAVPKPGLYHQSQQMIETIIDEKMSIEMCKEAFQKYFRLDNKYLGEILIRLGDLYVAQNNKAKARETYIIVKEAFARDTLLLKQAEERLAKLE